MLNRMTVSLAALLVAALPFSAMAQTAEERAYGLPGDAGIDAHGVRINRPAPIENPFATPAYDGPPSPRSAEALLRTSRENELLRAEAEARLAAAERDRRARDVYYYPGYPGYPVRYRHGNGLRLQYDDGTVSGQLIIGSPGYGKPVYRPWPQPEPAPTRPLQ